MRVLFTGGGTAGHINPALAAAGYFRAKQPDAEILFVGNKGGMEEKLVPPAGYDMKTIHISGFQRKLSLKNIARNVGTVSKLLSSTLESKRIIKEFRPDVCVGTGGYVCGPVLREAAKLGIPCVVHESNAFPGVTVKMLSKYLKTVMLAVPDAAKYFDESVHTVVTGNPVRAEILSADRDKARAELGLDERPVILSFGGSLGAAKINDAMVTVLSESSKLGKFQHIHGYGQHDPDFIPKLIESGVTEESAPQIRCLEYISNMAECLAAADLVICRCGAMTLTEIETMGKASILIPSPNVAENHQFHNAMSLVNAGAGDIIEEKDLSGDKLWETVLKLTDDPDNLKVLGDNAKKLSVPDAGQRIYEEIVAAAQH